ncbi:MAG: PEP-utilizing enzyme, partial [Candidatus Magasanikiibacteriota bacterium]
PNHHGWPAKILKKLLDGQEVGVDTFCIHEDSGLHFYADYNAWNEGSDYLLQKIKNKHDFVKSIFLKSKKIAKESIDLIRYFEKQDILSWSNLKLSDFLKKSYQLGNDFSAYGFIPVFSDHLFLKYTHLLKNIIKTKIKVNSISITEPEVMHSLSSHAHFIPSKQAKIKLLRLVLGFKGSVLSLKDKNRIESYYHDWFWVNFGQLGPRAQLSELLQSVEKIFNNKQQAKKELKELLDYPKQLKLKQKEFNKILNLNSEEKYLFSIAREFMYLKGLRMEVLFGIYASWSKLLDELAKRWNIQKELLYYTSVTELLNWLRQNKKPNQTILKERQKFCVCIAKTEWDEIILTGDKAKKFLKSRSYKEDKKIEDVLVIHGTVASVGYAKGKVKIVNKVSEIDKVKDGDILVSVATYPALLPAMKKAVAFITDSGGITCHAAIVAREMHKPCIIGTKIATKILKDNDLVEIDTKKGDIKRILK